MHVAAFLLVAPAVVQSFPTIGRAEHYTNDTLPQTNVHANHNISPNLLATIDERLRYYPQILHHLESRDSITIEIQNSFNGSNVSNAQNNVKFQVINNAKNAAIAMGDDARHNVTLDSFGDKNMINSTGSATGGWNTKNHDTNISTEPHKRDEVSELQSRAAQDFINVNILNGKVRGSNLTRVGNENSVELHIAGGGDNVVNVTIAWEAEDSEMADSISGNTVKIFLGELKEDLGNNTVVIM